MDVQRKNFILVLVSFAYQSKNVHQFTCTITSAKLKVCKRIKEKRLENGKYFPSPGMHQSRPRKKCMSTITRIVKRYAVHEIRKFKLL